MGSIDSVGGRGTCSSSWYNSEREREYKDFQAMFKLQATSLIPSLLVMEK
jgi:hypothetical protein